MIGLLPGFIGVGAAGITKSIEKWSTSNSGLFQYGVIFATFLLLTVAIFIWAACFRPHRRQHHSHRHSRQRAPESPREPEARNGNSGRSFLSSLRGRRHRRRRRRPERRCNPTLAETGGLPPLRAGDSEPPPRT